MTNKPSLRDWFYFEDREKYSPVKTTSITTHALIDHRSGPLSEIGSMREEWLIRSVLVDADHVKDVRHPADPHAFDFSPSWNDNVFDFGDQFTIQKTPAYPLIVTRTHPISDELEVELRPDFRWYHFLPMTGGEFRHPLDGIVVASLTVEKHEHFNPLPRMTLHPDYLRDYLAARRFALIIAIAADRFATRSSVAELEIESTGKPIELDDNTRIWPLTNVESGSAWGRSSLYWSMVVLPYGRPRHERSAWHYFGDLPEDGTASVTFIVDGKGTRGTAKDAGIRYLYFKREVLRKYLESPGYGVYFHMRNWGGASTPMNKSVDTGVNEEQLVTAFAPDIADLPAPEQAYWASFNVVPSGGVCKELFQTRMMLAPPHSPSLPELIKEARGALDGAFKNRYGNDLYRKKPDDLPSRQHLSVGPVTENIKEFLDLAKTLYAIAVEDLDDGAIKKALPPDQRPGKGETLRSIALMERLLVSLGNDAVCVRSLTDRLRALNRLRVIEAHLLSTADVEKEFEFWGVDVPRSCREMWHVTVDAVTKTLHEIATLLQPGSA
jgi:hypothetical protein